MIDTVPRVHQFLATLVASPAAVSRVSDLWSAYRTSLSRTERRRARRRDFVEALRGAGPVGVGHHGEAILCGYSTDAPQVMRVDPLSKRIIRV